jgi:hypothetical protein
MSPIDRVVQLYPQAPGSLFVSFSDSQGYCGGILTRLHMGLNTDISNYNFICVGFEVLTAVVMKSTIFWGIMLCSPLSADFSEEHITSIFRVEK